MDDRWLSMKEISEYLGARRETIYRWIETKGMPDTVSGAAGNLKKTKLMHG